MDLVIVESPSKAKTICKYLGSNYKVLASGGHVRDLPPNKLGVNVHNNFEPEYEVYPQKQTTIKQLKKEVANAEKVYLATDPDREGEAISWHLKHLLGIKEDDVRIVFNEITKKAVNNAIAQPHKINLNLVNSQQARRVLDRLVGYLVSPILSKKIAKGLSGGRVQSVALRMIVDREREIIAFKPEEYWNIFAFISPNQSIYYKSQFNDINGKKKKITNKDNAMDVVENSKKGVWSVDSVKRANSFSKPNAPFTTSTLQQDAVNKLNLSASQVMRTAQELYEGVNIKGEGQHALVTYIRTDSVRISDDAQAVAKEYIISKYGKEFCPSKPNVYTAKQNAQDAHEAIRPVNLEYTPEQLKGKIENNQYRLYKLIFERFLASQMVRAEYDTLTVHIISDANNTKYGYQLKGKTMTFPGYTIVYQNVAEEEEDTSGILPPFTESDSLNLKEITFEQKFTKPPSRYTDSSLVKGMEENGIGRPSTYASIISVLGKRNYYEKDGKFMKPTELGIIVCDQMIEYFADIMNLQFTADMEKKLDKVEDGNVDWRKIISDFYPGFLKCLEQANDGQKVKIEPIMTDIVCDKCGKQMMIREGKYGKFLGCSGFPNCNNIKPYEPNKSPEDIANEPLIICEKCGKPMTLKNSKYGKFYGCTGYPDCKHTIKYAIAQKGLKQQDNQNNESNAESDVETEKVICEKCGAEMVEKQGRFGKFYGCSNYPNCKNIVSIKKS